MQQLRSFRDDLIAAAHYAGAEAALIDASDAVTLSFEDATKRIGQAGKLLDDLAVPPGGVVVSLLPNTAWHCLFFAGATASGRGYAALPPDCPVQELAACMDLLLPEVVLAPRHTHPALLAAIKQRAIMTVLIDTADPFAELPAAKLGEGLRAARNAGALFVRTSGTTGAPRYLRHDVDVLWTAGQRFAAFHDVNRTGRARFLNIFPFDYLAATFNTCMIPWSVGAAVVYDADYRQGGLTSRIWSDVTRHDVTVLWLTPTMLRSLNKDLDSPLETYARQAARTLETVFVGMATVGNDDKMRFEQGFGVPVLENYALSETTFLTSETVRNRTRGGTGSSGRVLPWVEMRAVPADEASNGGAADGAAGQAELVVRSPYLASGAVGPSGRIEPLPVDRDGYFHTADTGRITPDGDVVLTGRLRDIIKRDDGLIQLHEIEARAEEHALVDRAAAVIFQDDLGADRYVLFVCGDKLGEAQAPTLEGWLHGILPRRMWPDAVMRVERMPLTANGKVMKRELAGRLPRRHPTQ